MGTIKADLYDALLAVHNHFEKPADLKLKRIAMTRVEKALAKAEGLETIKKK
jgi:hypothetical protein